MSDHPRHLNHRQPFFVGSCSPARWWPDWSNVIRRRVSRPHQRDGFDRRSMSWASASTSCCWPSALTAWPSRAILCATGLSCSNAISLARSSARSCKRVRGTSAYWSSQSRPAASLRSDASEMLPFASDASNFRMARSPTFKRAPNAVVLIRRADRIAWAQPVRGGRGNDANLHASSASSTWRSLSTRSISALISSMILVTWEPIGSVYSGVRASKRRTYGGERLRVGGHCATRDCMAASVI
jgi:hypothetical protein